MEQGDGGEATERSYHLQLCGSSRGTGKSDIPPWLETRLPVPARETSPSCYSSVWSAEVLFKIVHGILKHSKVVGKFFLS